MPRASVVVTEANQMKQVLLLILITSLSACGGYHQAKRGGGAQPAPRPQPQQQAQTVTAPIAITPTVVGVTTPGVAPSPGVVTAPVTVASAPAGVTRPLARGETPTRVATTAPSTRAQTAPSQAVVTQASLTRSATSRRKPFARGPISKACMASDRKARSRELCGCIQAVADQRLSNSQQKTAVGFYSNPHRAQEIRQSDKASHEAFWKDYKAYGEAAKRTCG